MVTLLLLSHSPKLAEGAKELAQEMAPDATIVAVGGTAAGTLGADFERTDAAMRAAAEQGDVVVLMDMGSTRMTAQMAAEALPDELAGRVHLSDAALAEGAMVAAIAINTGLSADDVLEQIAPYILEKD